MQVYLQAPQGKLGKPERVLAAFAKTADIISTGSQLSQNTAIFYADGEYLTSFTVAGSNGQKNENAKKIQLTTGDKCITVKYPKAALSVACIRIYTEKK